MRVAVTGARGFLAWHLQSAMLAVGGFEVVPLAREEFIDVPTLRGALASCEAVVHLAGVNRGRAELVEEQNRWLAVALAEALRGSAVHMVVHGNSIHAGTSSAFGRSKAWAAETLARGAAKAGASFTDVLLPNLFGEGGRPHYNSVVATFCHELVEGRRPVVVDDKELPLLHAQDAVDVLLEALAGTSSTIAPQGRPTAVSHVLGLLEEMAHYPRTGEFPDLSSPFRVALFHTFQSFCFPGSFPIDRDVHRDSRGSLFESARARHTDTLSFVSTTVPGAVRGQHFHRRKVERFLVVDGEAEIKLRRLVTHEEVAFRVNGERPQVVDMPPLWAHSLKNCGSRPVTTVFWTNELLDPKHPDTYSAPVYV